jgi:hypothetical protein
LKAPISKEVGAFSLIVAIPIPPHGQRLAQLPQ